MGREGRREGGEEKVGRKRNVEDRLPLRPDAY